MEESIVFARVGWMEPYQSSVTGEPGPIGEESTTSRTWIATGISDGSMRPELDPEITLHAVLNAVVRTQRRLASLGSKVEKEYGKAVGALFREAMRVILLGLLHDWSIESKLNKDNPSAAGGGLFSTDIGWYRRSFQAPEDWTGRTISVEFDGIYRNATVYLNGVKLITQPYGYTSFRSI